MSTITVEPNADVRLHPRRTNRLTLSVVLAFAIVGLALICTVLGDWLILHDPAEARLGDKLLSPMSQGADGTRYVLGTDALGRDILSRLISGARVSVLVAAGVVAIGVVVGTTLGLIAGLSGRWVDAAVMRLIDVLLAFPGLILVILVITFLGAKLAVLIGVLGFFAWMIYARLVRGRTMQLTHALHVRAVTIIGAGRWRVVRRYLIPALVPVIATQALLDGARVVLAESSLSYLGLGIQSPDVSWGLMVAENQQYLATAWWTVFFPGVAIALFVLSVNIISRWLTARTEAPTARARRSGNQPPREGTEDTEDTEDTETHSPRPLIEAAPAAEPRAPSATVNTGAHVESHHLTAGSGEETLLAVDNLRIDYPRSGGVIHAVHRLSFTVSSGECVALVGESGSGKSSTAMAVLDLLPTAARVHVDDIRWRDDSMTAAQRHQLRGRNVGYIYQDPIRRLSPLVGVGDQIAESLRRHRGMSRRAASAAAVHLLDSVGIPDAGRRARSRPHEFSGGMAQRVMIAVALAPEPELLIADEPTAALDVTIQAQILDLLVDLKETRGLGLLMISHDLGAVASVSDRVIVMRAGEAVEHGDTASVLACPQHTYTQALLASTPRIDPTDDLPADPATPFTGEADRTQRLQPQWQVR